ncbi:MAG: hypothetical protein GY853_10910 [PVC group bacterium]|nr:hypothetical protein [PVC group bacterium]
MNLLLFMFRDKEVLKRIFITIGVVLFARLIYFLPVPGIQIKAIAQLYQQHIIAQGGTFWDLITLMHAGKLRSISLFALGIMPYINACIVVQIIGFLVPGVNRKFFYKPDGRREMMLATLAVAVVLSMVHAYFLSFELELLDKFPDFQLLTVKGILFRAGVMASMSAACLLFIMLSEVINRFGLGNGVGIIFASEVIVRIGISVSQATVFFIRGLIMLRQFLLFIGLVVLFVYIAKRVTGFLKKLTLQTHKNETFSIPIRPIWVGVWPLILAEAVLSFFELPVGWTSFFVIGITIAFSTLLYLKVVYQPRRFYELILPYKCLSCSDQSKRVVDVLNNAIIPCIAVSLLLFFAMYSLPLILPFTLRLSFMSAGIFGAFGLIILVGVCHDISRQLQFFQAAKQNTSVKQWCLLGTAFDEAEAEIKKACLQSHDIYAEVKPSHFYWGLPIRTAASGYYMYVSADQYEQAKQTLKELRSAWREKAI